MHEERLQILQMIAQGKLSPEQGEELLKALGGETNASDSQEARWLVIRVFEAGAHRPKHNVRFPLRFAGKMLRFANRFVDDVELDLEELYLAISTGAPGKIMEVEQENGDFVEIFLEV
ncbi:MAG: hypothetical protein FH749_13020 [Firmicutes bacterium]|nr:hypothetical protein [Bacillota bacterium]